MMKFTIFGGSGFIGYHLSRHLCQRGHQVSTPPRGAVWPQEMSLGHVIYAIGLTGDFRNRRRDTIDAHVNLLEDYLAKSSFESWMYLSSTRIYSRMAADSLATEDNDICLYPSADSLYDLSKLLGEAICLARGSASVRVVRLSNVYGIGQSANTFLGAVLTELRREGRVVIGEHPDSWKDYVSIEDVVNAIEAICVEGKQRIYNIASGVNVPHRELAARLEAEGAGAVVFGASATLRTFPAISIDRLRNEFAFKPRSLLEDIPSLLV